MIKIQRPRENQSIAVIRAASYNEFTKYERQKLAEIEEKAQQNKLEAINLNGEKVLIDPNTKTAQIELGDLAFKNTISFDEINDDNIFIECTLDDSILAGESGD